MGGGQSAERLFQEACLLKASLHAKELDHILNDRERHDLTNRIVALSEEALSKDLSSTSAVSAKATIGDLLVARAMVEDRELSGLRNSGPAASPTAVRAMSAYESALRLDASLPRPFFADQNQRNVHFHVGFTQFLWVVRAFYIRRSQDSDAAIAYLKSILSLFEYLKVPVAWWITGVIAGMYEDRVRPGVTVNEAHAAFAQAAEWWEYSLRCERMPDSEVQAANMEQFGKNLQRVKAKAAKTASPTTPASAQSTPKSPGGCFVATAACGDPLAPEVIALSDFRDEVLVRSRMGRALISLYYTTSPPVAALIARFSVLRNAALALVVRPAVRLVRRVPDISPRSQL
jgi:hypothetical protein